MEIEAFEAPAPMGIESFDEPVDAGAALPKLESFEAPKTWQPAVHAYGWTQLYGSVDTRFDSPRGAAMAAASRHHRAVSEHPVDL